MFLPASLDELVNNLYKMGEQKGNVVSVFPHLERYFINKWKTRKSIPDCGFTLLLRKGIFPYSWFNSFKRFNKKKLPSRKHFYNDLKDEPVSEKDYQHAKRVWRVFKLQSFQEFHDLYLEKI